MSDVEINELLKYYTLYALSINNPNIKNEIVTTPDIKEQFEYVFENLRVYCDEWYNILNSKSSTELEKIKSGLENNDSNFLNSNPLHSIIVLDLKAKLELYNFFNLSQLKTNIIPHRQNIGYVTIEFLNRKQSFEAKAFCLANFQYMVYEQDGTNWKPKLKYYVKEMKLTHLYVQGSHLARLLTDYLDSIPVRPITCSNTKMTKCVSCKKWYCSVSRMNFYFKNFHNIYFNYKCNP